MDSVEKLQERIKELEKQLVELKLKDGEFSARDKVEQMSSEVVDTNPYR